MPTTPYLPPAPTSQGSNLSQADYMWMLIVQGLAPLYEVDTSKGSYSEALPPAGVGTSGQTGQGKEIIYVKTSADANTDTITGAKTGPVTLSTQYQVARFKSDGTYWYAVNSSSGSSLSLEVNGTPNIDQALLNLFAGSGITITDDGAGKIVIAASPVAATGLPIIPLPGGSPGGGAGLLFAATQTLANVGQTTWQYFTGRGLLNAAARWTITVNVSGAQQVSSMNLAKCTQDTGAVVATQPITFGGLSAFTLAIGDNTSDAISFALSSQYDYCFRWFTPTGSGDLELLTESNSATNQPGAVFSGTDDTDHTADSPIVLTGFGNNLLGYSVIKRFVTA